MTEVAWVVLQQNNRFLLAQRSLLVCAGGTWNFPGGKYETEDVNVVTTAYRELKEEIGIEGERFRKLFHTHLNQYLIHVFLCDKWHGKLRLAYKEVIGVGWFTFAEMYALGKSLAPFVNDSLLYMSYMIQHYDHHPNELKEQWRDRCGSDD